MHRYYSTTGWTEFRDLFTLGVRGRGILRTSHVRGSEKFGASFVL